MVKSGFDYQNEGMIDGCGINMTPFCTHTACVNHCKKWCIRFARRMTYLLFCFIQYVCGTLGVPDLVANYGGTGTANFLNDTSVVANAF